jgi:hypothetical protein
MTRACLALVAIPLCVLTRPAAAQEISYNGLADLRLVAPSNQRSWMNGGLGKLRFNGGEDSNPNAHIGEISADGRAQLTPEFAMLGTLRYTPEQRTTIDFTEAYARYQPLAAGPWRATTKLGAFYPPISLENEGVAWSSPWTLTPSAINTWVGEELRTIGGEQTAEWQYGSGALQGVGALYGWNSPAGTLLAHRGWALGDRPTGLLDTLRQPDVYARRQGRFPPVDTEPFAQIGGGVGWYGGASWRENGVGRVQILRYDNEANPREYGHSQFAWETRFTSIGLETSIGDITILSQAMLGDTEVDPTGTVHSLTRFKSAYLLAGRYFGDWSLAGRIEFFGTNEERTGGGLALSERGHAYTAAVSREITEWMRVTLETLRVNSYRGDRINDGVSPRAVEDQIQLSARLFF